ncbi:MAG TPA: histidine kinase dimerization/phosphoacceptor domain -containing protein, partial [Candidatus Limnocylindria bacterium]|nr:histidine kinase dimerization/phosphoacceptor domain -containing protein [Candidatus Limnocylindria bacterium]
LTKQAKMSDQRQESGVTRLLRQQAALAAFGSYAFREPLLLNVLNEAARVCAECLEVPFCKICRYREAENDLLIEAGHGWQAGVVGLVVSQADETSPQGRAYITGLPVILQNLGEANDVMLPAFYGLHGIVSTVDVIIKGMDGEPYGVLEIDSPTQHTYDQHDVDFLTGFANVLAEAVATAKRNEKLHRTIEKMEALVVEKDKLLDERAMLAEELKHRVRNNLQLVHGMLASHVKNQSGAEEKASVNAIIRRVLTLAEVYEQLLGTGMGRTIDLGEYLKSLCGSLPGLQKDSNSDVELSCLAESLLVDLDTVTALGMIVAELVSNSYEHALPNISGTIIDYLRRSKTADEAVLTVSDNGTGFVEQAGSKRHGVGLVRRLVQQVHGTAELQSERGTVWTFRFPIAVPAVERTMVL